MKKVIIYIIVIIAILIVGGFLTYNYMMNKSRNKFRAMEVPTTVRTSEFSREFVGEHNTFSQWRGKNRDGIYHENGLLTEWPTDGPQLLWHIEGLGDGYSSPAIANGKIYVTGIDGDNLILFVFDLNGKFLNRTVVGIEWDRSYPGTRSTVTVSDGKLYIFSSVGHLYCLNEKTLELVWKKDVLTDFDGRNLRWGMTESPLVIGDKVIITPGGRVNNVVALNKKTGELIWSSQGMGEIST